MELPRLNLGMNDEGMVNWKHPYTHMVCLGKSGTGKSSLMKSMIRQDSYYPTAKIIIDPSGFLAQDAWAISKGKAIYCSVDHPVSINPMHLHYDDDVISDIVAECINQVVERTTPNERLTVKMRQILDTSVKWNLERNRKSLVHVRDHIDSLKGDLTARDGLLARLNFLLNNRSMEEIICGNDSISIEKLIDKGKTLILDCKGMSEEKMVFVGSMLTQQIKAHFRFSRVKEYKPLRVYIDECHNFLNQNVISILKEGRKYKFSFVLMTTDFSDINPNLIRSMVNVGTLACFRLGFREAQIFAREIGLGKAEFLLQDLPKYTLAVMTPEIRDVCKAPRPPWVKPMETPRGEPQKKRGWKGWFNLESCQPET